MRRDDHHSVRALLIFVFVPVAIVLGVLASAVLGSGGSNARAPAARLVPAAPAPPPAPPDEPVAAVAAAPAVAPPVGTTPAAPATAPQPPPPPGSAPVAPPPPATTPAVPAPAPAPAPEAPPAPEPSSGYAPPGTERFDVGLGAQGAAIFRAPGSATEPGPVVIFLHGWVAVDPQRYGPWIGHLVRGGSTVIYPAYQTKPAYDTIAPLANVLAGVRTALTHVQPAPGRLVAAGHSAGGALAADYAAVATANDVPAPAAVFSVYPGRKLRHLTVPIPSANLSLIAAGTRVLAFVGERDTAVGSGTAQRLVAGATQANATLRVIRDDAVDDHSAPRRFDGTAQRTFWQPLDALVAETAQRAGTARGAAAAGGAPGAP